MSDSHAHGEGTAVATAAAAGHDEHGAEEIRKHVRVYLMVFVALAVLTVITVAVSYLHLPVGQSILVALVIASVKGSLVALFFMHLISERTLIYWTLLICVVFFAVLMLVPTLTVVNMRVV
jgi:cytochrome c oxidase subunit 4